MSPVLSSSEISTHFTLVRNTYTKLDFGSWSGNDDDDSDPYIQLLSITDVDAASKDFIEVRLGGEDTTGESQWQLTSTADMQHSPVSDEEKKKLYQEMILSRWPYILTGCLVAVLIIVGLVVWRCCCRRNKDGSKGAFCCHKRPKKLPMVSNAQTSYLPLQDKNSMRGGSTASLPYSQNSYNQSSFTQNTYDQSSYEHNTYDHNAYGADPYAGPPHSPNPAHGNGGQGFKAY